MTTNLRDELFIVTGVSGRTGAAAADALLKAGKRVRVVVRDATKGAIWCERGAELACANFNDVEALSRAFSGGYGAYIVSPPQYSSDALFEQADAMARNIEEAVANSQLQKVVALSSIGADKRNGTGWIAMNRRLEAYLGRTGIPVSFLRAAYFMENWGPMVHAARHGELPSFLAPLDRKIPMIATEDIGRIAAEALSEDWSNVRILELEGPAQYSPMDVADCVSRALSKLVVPAGVPISSWPQALSGAGFSTAALKGFTEMTKGLNSGHISFVEENAFDRRTGVVSLNAVISAMVASEER